MATPNESLFTLSTCRRCRAHDRQGVTGKIRSNKGRSRNVDPERSGKLRPGVGFRLLRFASCGRCAVEYIHTIQCSTVRHAIEELDSVQIPVSARFDMAVVVLGTNTSRGLVDSPKSEAPKMRDCL